MVAMVLQNTKTNSNGTAPHVLVVDDEIDNCLLLQRILMRKYHISMATSGEEALELLKTDTFDSVLLDIMMPTMTGLQTLKIIRATPETADLPVILISALSATDDIVNGLEAGANDYIPKPIDVDETQARVDTQVTAKQMNDERKRVIRQLEAAQEMKDRLLRIASHDLKAPLANIRMAEYILRDFVGQDAMGNEVLDAMVETVNGMTQVIEEFLDMAACQSGKIEVNLQLLPVANVINETILNYQVTALHKDIAVETGRLDGVVVADKSRLSQVMNNLVSNAVKYSPKNTTIRVWTEATPEHVRIHVADQGPGIPMNEREKLFKEFSKLSSRPTGGESSSGLGLWIVKHLVTLQKGEVGVECPPDGGSIFWVELPAGTDL